MITDLNSPLPRTNIPEAFEDLICQEKEIIKSYKDGADLRDWVVKAHGRNMLGTGAYRQKKAGTCFQILSLTYNVLEPQFVYLLLDFVIFMMPYVVDPSKSILDVISMQTIVLLIISKSNHSYFPDTANFTSTDMPDTSEIITLAEPELVKCGRTVLVCETFEINSEFEYLTRKYPWVTFYKGKPKIL